MQHKEMLRDKIRIAIVDYSNCAFSALNHEDPDFLASTLMQFISKQGYQYFVGHTFRCLANNDNLLDSALEIVPATEEIKFRNAYRIAAITKNIRDRTKVNCLQIATLDDLVNDEVGLGYKDLEDYEAYGVTSENPHAESADLPDYYKQNNEFLLRIANACANYFQNHLIELDIIDDNLKNLRDALSVNKQVGWPPSVTIRNVYRYDASLKDNLVVKIKIHTLDL